MRRAPPLWTSSKLREPSFSSASSALASVEEHATRLERSVQQKWLEGETSVSEMQKAVRQPEEAQRERADTAAAAHATILVTVLEPRSLRPS